MLEVPEWPPSCWAMVVAVCRRIKWSAMVGRMCRPCGVSSTPRQLRLNTAKPSSASIRLIRRLMVGWMANSSWASRWHGLHRDRGRDQRQRAVDPESHREEQEEDGQRVRPLRDQQQHHPQAEQQSDQRGRLATDPVRDPRDQQLTGEGAETDPRGGQAHVLQAHVVEVRQIARDHGTHHEDAGHGTTQRECAEDDVAVPEDVDPPMLLCLAFGLQRRDGVRNLLSRLVHVARRLGQVFPEFLRLADRAPDQESQDQTRDDHDGEHPPPAG